MIYRIIAEEERHYWRLRLAGILREILATTIVLDRFPILAIKCPESRPSGSSVGVSCLGGVVADVPLDMPFPVALALGARAGPDSAPGTVAVWAAIWLFTGEVAMAMALAGHVPGPSRALW